VRNGLRLNYGLIACGELSQRDGDEYRLTIDPSSLSSDERDELVRLCDEAISVYL
jgi:hypothetical protein